MGNAKKIHQTKTRIGSSRRSRSRAFYRKANLLARRSVLVIIVMSMLVVILAVLSRSFTNPETIVKNEISRITTDYYENYYYDKITSYVGYTKDLSEILDKYSRSGFTSIKLRQLLLSSEGVNSTVSEYCDIEETSIRIFPDPPYGKKDYHIEYHYACSF